MQREKNGTSNHVSVLPILCSGCLLQISASDLWHVHEGKNYHRTCFRKLNFRLRAGKVHSSSAALITES